IMRKRLDKLADFIKEKVPDVEIQSMVDTGVLSDRAVAERAGLGFTGRNGFVISPELGTWSYLGEMLVSIPFEPDDPLLDSCGDCTICVDRCPTGALVGNGQLNSQKCISFLTQTKGYLQDEYRYKIGNRLYGCDTCQQVCPKNRGINTQHDDIVLEPEILKALNDPRPMIRGTAYWAIGQILEDDAISFIDEHYENEIEEVQLEMKKGLQMRREQK
ncbi:MAG: tRNA epoxyqueuosine(34) reductase QueG, partial [Staphylococcus epidermidis]